MGEITTRFLSVTPRSAMGVNNRGLLAMDHLRVVEWGGSLSGAGARGQTKLSGATGGAPGDDLTRTSSPR
jgi:hypothetical protein